MEYKYLELLRKILEEGEEREDRTGVGTLSLFGEQYKCDLQAGFPILTTKKVHWRSVVNELLWMLRGDTNVKSLNSEGVTIWDEWADENGDLGPIYGQQWTQWGPPGTDKDGTAHLWPHQLAGVIDQIKTNPYSRQLLVSAWNVGQLSYMALLPCHVMFQFYVSKGKLSCHMYQRSADIFLGGPFNIASYALLTHIIARETSLLPGDLIISFGDVHLYKNHIVQAKEQLTRTPKAPPRLKISNRSFDIDMPYGCEDAPRLDDFVLEDYFPHPAIKAQVAV